LKEARFDVFKFGIKGLNKDEQENAKVQLAVKLGAKVRFKKTPIYKLKVNICSRRILIFKKASQKQMRKLQGHIETEKR
jgi:hypothetical protein